MSKNIKKITEDLERYQELYKKRMSLPAANFWKMLSISHLVYMKASTELQSDTNIAEERKRDAISQSAKNLIINLVTATEVFLKDLMRDICDKYTKFLTNDGLSELLKEKISLREAFILLKDKEISLGEFIGSYFLFESIMDIDNKFTKLTGKNFLNEIEKLEFNLDESKKKFFGKEKLCLVQDFPKWREEINKMFRLRHEFVHHLNFSDPVSYKTVYEILDSVTAFITVLECQYRI